MMMTIIMKVVAMNRIKIGMHHIITVVIMMLIFLHHERRDILRNDRIDTIDEPQYIRNDINNTGNEIGYMINIAAAALNTPTY